MKQSKKKKTLTQINLFFSSFKEIQRIDPSLELENIESSKATLRTWIFEDV